MDFIWLVILLAIFFALPDLLRKKRRYPNRKQNKPGPMGMPAPQPEKPKPIEMKKKRQSIFTKPQPAPEIKKRPLPPPPVQKGPETATMPVPDTLSGEAAHIDTVPVGKPVLAIHKDISHAWEELNPTAQQIYAGIVWSELLQPPVSLRRRR
jgi:hypothetical protein